MSGDAYMIISWLIEYIHLAITVMIFGRIVIVVPAFLWGFKKVNVIPNLDEETISLPSHANINPSLDLS